MARISSLVAHQVVCTTCATFLEGWRKLSLSHSEVIQSGGLANSMPWPAAGTGADCVTVVQQAVMQVVQKAVQQAEQKAVQQAEQQHVQLAVG